MPRSATRRLPALRQQLQSRRWHAPCVTMTGTSPFSTAGWRICWSDTLACAAVLARRRCRMPERAEAAVICGRAATSEIRAAQTALIALHVAPRGVGSVLTR